VEGLTVGEGAFINYGCFFDLASPTAIGRDVHLEYQVMLCTSSHHVGGKQKRVGAIQAAPIVIEDGAWLGAPVVVMPGVTIGAGSVVAAGSVLTGDCQPDSLYAGTPAVWKRSLTADERAVTR
jgi:acetyltransferase-like isoleucine patch superfamily enzyme